MIVILNPQVNIPFAWRDFWAKHPCVDGVQVLFRVLHHKRPHLYPRTLASEDLDALEARPLYGVSPEGRLGTYTGTVDLTFDSQEELWVLAARALQDIDPHLRPEVAVGEAARYLTWWIYPYHGLDDDAARGRVVEAVARQQEDTSI